MNVEGQAHRDWIFQRLKHSLQALALPCEEQIELFPKTVVIADELALDFDHWQSCAISNYPTEMTEQQLRAIALLDAKLQSASKGADKSCWQQDVLCVHPLWRDVRELAKRALENFDWQPTVPPNYKHEYVSGKRSDSWR